MCVYIYMGARVQMWCVCVCMCVCVCVCEREMEYYPVIKITENVPFLTT